MKLSEILGWPKEKEYRQFDTNTAMMLADFYNAGLIDCDREIDEKSLQSIVAKGLRGRKSSHEITTELISTMPQWMKGVKNEAK